ncbi:hypothetical protein ATANTOWER_008758 [Ataeniobius toweri]|uniref:Uncharacterized protein n=1 Tax=Ataeniobius toweri TaxID=208326 RepID=A0ABU7CA16_9TELE|nr:hypothetical protein [Ataeniobius toweri]
MHNDDGRRRDCTCHNRLIEDLQHPAAKTEGPKLLQVVRSALSFCADGFTVASLLQCVVQASALFCSRSR